VSYDTSLRMAYSSRSHAGYKMSPSSGDEIGVELSGDELMKRKAHEPHVRAKTGRLARVERAPNRVKLSTTVAAENLAYLGALVRAGRTGSIAEAVDLAIARLQREENRARLARATARYFEGLTPEARSEEDDLANRLSDSVSDMDFDREL
jgi:hypothetical protein